MTIDTTKLKPYTIENARNGDKAIIVWPSEANDENSRAIPVLGIAIHPNDKHDFVIAVMFLDEDGGWAHETFIRNGPYSLYSPHACLLVAPKIVTKWAFCYKGASGEIYMSSLAYSSQEEARASIPSNANTYENFSAFKTISFEVEE